MGERKRFTYSPPFAPHVTAEIDEREHDPKTGLPEEQRIDMHCTTCGEKCRRTCSSGHVRGHVQRFAILHLHRDPMRDPVPGLPGMPEE